MDKETNFQRPNISIILPVYNVEKQLVKCLNSISNQEFSGTFEIIACEASSTDNSLALLKSYQEKEPRLKIIEHGYRAKLSTSRVTGINVSTGDYIMHVDSDDWLLPNAVEKLFQICLETNADVVVFNYINETSEGKQSLSRNIKKKLITTDKLKVQHHFYGACWNKIVKRAMNENMIYSEIGITTSEDFPYSTEILLKAEKICLTTEPFYVYFKNTDSPAYSRTFKQFLNDQIVILNQLQKIVFEYKANQKYIGNTLNYFEKWIYLQLAKIHFWQKEKLGYDNNLIGKFSQFPILTNSRIKRLKLSIKYKYINLLEVTIRLGLKLTLGIIRKSFKK